MSLAPLSRTVFLCKHTQQVRSELLRSKICDTSPIGIHVDAVLDMGELVLEIVGGAGAA